MLAEALGFASRGQVPSPRPRSTEKSRHDETAGDHIEYDIPDVVEAVRQNRLNALVTPAGQRSKQRSDESRNAAAPDSSASQAQGSKPGGFKEHPPEEAVLEKMQLLFRLSRHPARIEQADNGSGQNEDLARARPATPQIPQ